MHNKAVYFQHEEFSPTVSQGLDPSALLHCQASFFASSASLASHCALEDGLWLRITVINKAEPGKVAAGHNSQKLFLLASKGVSMKLDTFIGLVITRACKPDLQLC